MHILFVNMAKMYFLSQMDHHFPLSYTLSCIPFVPVMLYNYGMIFFILIFFC